MRLLENVTKNGGCVVFGQKRGVNVTVFDPPIPLTHEQRCKPETVFPKVRILQLLLILHKAYQNSFQQYVRREPFPMRPSRKSMRVLHQGCPTVTLSSIALPAGAPACSGADAPGPTPITARSLLRQESLLTTR